MSSYLFILMRKFFLEFQLAGKYDSLNFSQWYSILLSNNVKLKHDKIASPSHCKLIWIQCLIRKWILILELIITDIKTQEISWIWLTESSFFFSMWLVSYFYRVCSSITLEPCTISMFEAKKTIIIWDKNY